MKKLVITLCAMVLAMGLAACSGGSGSSAASSGSADAASGSSAAAGSAETAAANLTDYGWIAFEMPEGWEDAKESDKYETIAETANNKHMMKFMLNTLVSSYPTAADKAADDIGKEYNHYTDGGTMTIGGYEWSIANFEFNGNPSFTAYADVADKRCLKITVYEMTPDDPAVQTVFSTLVVNQDELW